jgi:hypothetical protein
VSCIVGCTQTKLRTPKSMLERRWTSGTLKRALPLQQLSLQTLCIHSKSPSTRCQHLPQRFQLHQMSQKVSTAPYLSLGMPMCPRVHHPRIQPGACATCCTSSAEQLSHLHALSLHSRARTLMIRAACGPSSRCLTLLQQKMMSAWLQIFCEHGGTTTWLSSCVTGCQAPHVSAGVVCVDLHFLQEMLLRCKVSLVAPNIAQRRLTDRKCAKESIQGYMTPSITDESPDQDISLRMKAQGQLNHFHANGP